MTIFRMNPAYAWSPEMLAIDGSVTIPTGLTLTGANTQVNPALLNGFGAPNPGTYNPNADETIAPLGSKAPVFLNPQLGTAPPTTNTNTLPIGLPTSITATLGSELVIDLSGFDADIVEARATLRTNTRDAVPARNAVVTVVDNANKLVYITVYTTNSTTPVSCAAGDVISFHLAMKDTFSA